MDELTGKETTKDLVEIGIKEFAKIETSLLDAQNALLRLRAIYPAAYVNGDLNGGEAINSDAACVSVAGDIASVRADVLKLHQAGAILAGQSGNDIKTPYAELPKREVTTRSGGER